MPLPAPRTWADGEDAANIPLAADLNLDWRDSFDFLLGYSVPIFYGYSTTGTAMTAATDTNVPINNELLKRGGMVHSTVTNNHLVTVPYTGQYVGFSMSGTGTVSSLPAQLAQKMFKNGTIITQHITFYSVTVDHEQISSFTIDCIAGDTIGMVLRCTLATSMNTTLLNCPRWGIWYAGDST